MITYSTLEQDFNVDHLPISYQELIQQLKQEDCKEHEKVIRFTDYYELYEVQVTEEQLLLLVEKRKERNQLIQKRRQLYKG